MKSNRAGMIGLGVLISLFVGGCSSTGPTVDGAQVDDRETSMSGAQTSGAQAGGVWSGNPLDNPDSPLYTKVIYFDFDQSEIRAEFFDVLRAHADYLSNNAGVNMIIEGHADERGSREYNIGLGERRAQAVLRFLEAQGVNPSQLSTLSYGEERPEDLGHYESAWTMNRRAVLNHQ